MAEVRDEESADSRDHNMETVTGTFSIPRLTTWRLSGRACLVRFDDGTAGSESQRTRSAAAAG
jgi:hypothetical protein